MSKNKIISFYPDTKDFKEWFDAPVPAKKNIPEWYKSQDKYSGGIKVVSPETGLLNSTVKACMPIFDIMTAGYIITTPVDIHVSINNDGSPELVWAMNDFSAISSHPVEQYDKFKIPKEFFPVGYKFINSWITNTPSGYSSIFITPAMRDDLPFYCLPAIVDTDKHPVPVNFPFFIRRDFEGVIPAGTPMIQIIPFKRDTWSHEVKDYTDSFWNKWKYAERKMHNRYKIFFRSNKEWN